uniref:Uncharacterized protein n=2 Tax=Aegilops tauschii subsp. strangulata TaxID=200361 RepID=A0A453SBY7_AEGTS
MALVPRSSLRSLVLLVSHGKPRLSSFFSSAAATPAAPGADNLPAAPAVHPPAPTGRSCPKLPVEEEFALHPIPGGPRPHPRPRPRPCGAAKDASVTDNALLNAPEDPCTYPDPDRGSDGIFEDPRHPVPDPSGRGRSAVTDEPAQCTQEHPKYPVTDSSTDKGPAVEHPAYTTPGYGSCSTPEPMPDKPPCGTSEDVKQRDVDPPPPAREGVGHRVVDPPRGGRGRRAVPDEPEQCAQEHPKYPVPDSSSDKVFSSCSSAVPPLAPGSCTPAAPDVQPPVTPGSSPTRTN